MLLDTASLYFRAFFGVPETVRAPDGTPVNAVRGLLDMISRLVRARHPVRLIACWDADWRPAFRVAAVPSYKAHRLAPDGASEETPPALAVQVPVIEDVLHAGIGIDTLLFEAPTTALQAHLIKRIGPNVNLGNVPAQGVIGLETLRLGLRADTLTAFE